MVPTNALHAVADKMYQFQFFSFPEYSACYDSAQHVVGADAHIGPFVRFHRTAIKCGNAAAVSPTAYFFCLARKSRQKDALGDAPYCALTRANFFTPYSGAELLFSR